MPKARLYRLYVDESGDDTFNRREGDHHRYLALLGVWFEQASHYPNFCGQLDRLKAAVFEPHPDDGPICLHRKDIIQRRGIFGRLCDPTLKTRFETLLLEAVAQGKFRMTCIVLDKEVHDDPGAPRGTHPR